MSAYEFKCAIETFHTKSWFNLLPNTARPGKLYKRANRTPIILEFIFYFYLKFLRRTQRTIDSYKVLAFYGSSFTPENCKLSPPRPPAFPSLRHPNYSRGVALELFAVSHSTHSDVRTFLSSVQRLMNEFPCHLSDDKGFVQRKKRNIAHVTSLPATSDVNLGLETGSHVKIS